MRPAAEAAEVSGGAGGQTRTRAPAMVDDTVDRMINPAQTEGSGAHRLMVILPIPMSLGNEAQSASVFIMPFEVDWHGCFPLIK